MALVDIRRTQRAPAADVAAILEKALRELPGHATLNSYYGRVLLDTGRIAEAEVYLRHAAGADPLSPGKKLNLAMELVALGKVDEATRVLDETLLGWHTPYLWRLRTLLAITDHIGHYSDVLTLIAPEDLAPGEVACWRDLDSAFHASNGSDNDRARSTIARCFDAGVLRGSLPIYALLALGDIDGFFTAADQLTHWTDEGVRAVFSARARAAQRDPRYMPLMQRLGMVDAWIARDNWPDFCESPDLPYDCREVAHRGQATAPTAE
jgi:hypothetical protein